MTNRTIDERQLRGLASALEELEPSPALEHRIRRGIESGAGTRRDRSWGVVLAVAAFAVGLAIGWWVFSNSAAEPPEPPASEVAARDVATRCVVEPSSGGTMNVPARCRISFSRFGVEVDAWERTVVHETNTGLRIDAGLAAFSVEKVAAGDPPVTVDVGAGTVKVIGTKFVIGNDARGGHLDLIEGQVEFLSGDEVIDVEPGRRLGWTHAHDGMPARIEAVGAIDSETSAASPEASEPEPPTSAKLKPTRPQPSRTSSFDLAAVLSDVARDRRLGEYARALERLAAVPQRGLPEETRVVLSYERGTLLEAAGRSGAACKHWKRHRTRYRDVGATDVEAHIASSCAE